MFSIFNRSRACGHHFTPITAVPYGFRARGRGWPRSKKAPRSAGAVPSPSPRRCRRPPLGWSWWSILHQVARPGEGSAGEGSRFPASAGQDSGRTRAVPGGAAVVAGIVKNLDSGSVLPGTQVSDDLRQRVLAASTRSLFAKNSPKLAFFTQSFLCMSILVACRIQWCIMKIPAWICR